MAHPTEAQVGDGPKEISPFPSSASISVHLRFKSAIGLTSKRAIDLSPIRVHQRASAVQKCDRPVRQKGRSTLPPSASVRVYLRFKSAIDLIPISCFYEIPAFDKSIFCSTKQPFRIAEYFSITCRSFSPIPLFPSSSSTRFIA